MDPEIHILQSWTTNASAWDKTISEEGIETRKLVTNDAIVNCIASCNPANLLDLGCGEGWLIRAVQRLFPDCRFTGMDAIPALIDTAKVKTGFADFSISSYQDIIEGKKNTPLPFDVITINFALFGNELVEQLLSAIQSWIRPSGRLIIQTLHPIAANGENIYRSEWRPGSWNGFSPDFSDPAPWYFRTTENWIDLFETTGYQVCGVKEPIHPVTGKPVSVIFILTPGTSIQP
jgi:2-polyprenyl-3-methyl-5-hydroxy-6-metoxy-1,4-benzoquinol methylase